MRLRLDPLSVLIVMVVLGLMVSGVNLWLTQDVRDDREREVNELVCDLAEANREQADAFASIGRLTSAPAVRAEIDRAVAAGEQLDAELDDTCEDG